MASLMGCLLEAENRVGLIPSGTGIIIVSLRENEACISFIVGGYSKYVILEYKPIDKYWSYPTFYATN